jgi:hypothetical protein
MKQARLRVPHLQEHMSGPVVRVVPEERLPREQLWGDALESVQVVDRAKHHAAGRADLQGGGGGMGGGGAWDGGTARRGCVWDRIGRGARGDGSTGVGRCFTLPSLTRAVRFPPSPTPVPAVSHRLLPLSPA